MTSLVRERRGPVRPAMVRERLLEHFAARFGFGRTSLFSDLREGGEQNSRENGDDGYYHE